MECSEWRTFWNENVNRTVRAYTEKISVNENVFRWVVHVYVIQFTK